MELIDVIQNKRHVGQFSVINWTNGIRELYFLICSVVRRKLCHIQLFSKEGLLGSETIE